MTTTDPMAQLGIAACDVLLAVSERNLRHGQRPTVKIPRGRLLELERTLEAAYPGYLARVRHRLLELEQAEREQHAANLQASREGRR